MPSWSASVRNPWRESNAVKHALLAAIADPSYHFRLPHLQPATWALLTAPGARDTIERLEYLGDSVLHACAGVELFFASDQASPHLMTNVRNWLVSNACFQMLIGKLGPEFNSDGGHSGLLSRIAAANGFPIVPYAGHPTHNPKTIADVFEVILGAYYLQNNCSFAVIAQWFRETFAPLVVIATDAFNSFYSTRSVLGKRRVQDVGHRWTPAKRHTGPYITRTLDAPPSRLLLRSATYRSVPSYDTSTKRTQPSASSTRSTCRYRGNHRCPYLAAKKRTPVPYTSSGHRATRTDRTKIQLTLGARLGDPGKLSARARAPSPEPAKRDIIDLTDSDSESDGDSIQRDGSTWERPAPRVWIIIDDEDEDAQSSELISRAAGSIITLSSGGGEDKPLLLPASGRSINPGAGCEDRTSSHTHASGRFAREHSAGSGGYLSDHELHSDPLSHSESDSTCVPLPHSQPVEARGDKPPIACPEFDAHSSEAGKWYSVLSQRWTLRERAH